ncbi:MAG TPA: septum formation initiator family protein [Syntrophomonadaceae bacterium]|jgi:cell division protein FtsB|nr:septum formation initiator family protein [Syntrophomonadaceae bacterium]HRX20226.1 septum formation initiator family protein [Syntrophomonadaceae bacterium]
MANQKKKAKSSRAKMVVLSIVGLVLIFSIFPRAKTIYELSLRKDALLEQQKIVEVQNKELSIKLKQSEQLQEVEKIAREKLGMIKPGEKYIVPVEEK